MLFNSMSADKAPSATLWINEQVQARWAAGETVYHLGFGESRFAVHPLLQAALAAHADRKSYLPAQGLAELRGAAADYYSNRLELDVASDQIIIGPGSKQLIFALQQALDADLFLLAPAWVSYAPQAALLGRPCTYIQSSMDHGHRVRVADIERALQQAGSAQKLLIINSPNNPSGQMLDRAFLQELAAYCRANQVIVISDEIYFLVVHGSRKHLSIASFYPEGSIVVGGLSKHLSLGGWRLGLAILPGTEQGRRLMAVLRAIASETWSSVAAPIQQAAIQAYRDEPELESYISTCTAIHGIRTRFLVDRLSALGIRCTMPEGGFYTVADFSRWRDALARIGIHTSTDLSRYLLQRHSLATLPTGPFGLPEEALSLRLATSYLDMERESDSERLLTMYASGMAEKEFMSAGHHPMTEAALTEFAAFVALLAGANAEPSSI